MAKLMDMQFFQNWPKRHFLQFCCACNNYETSFLPGGSVVFICIRLLKNFELKVTQLNNLTSRVNLAPFAKFTGVVRLLIIIIM
jgi:hypothetical protein